MLIIKIIIFIIILIILLLRYNKCKQKLILEEKFKDEITDNINSLILTFDEDYNITSFNKYLKLVTGHKDLIGKNFFEILEDNVAKEKLKNKFPDILKQNKSQQSSITTQIISSRNNDTNKEYLISWSFSKIENLGQKDHSFLAIGTDITELHNYKKTLEYQGYHDDLTGLPNRRYFNHRLKKEVEYSNNHNYKFAVMFLNIDRFKLINSIHGHHIGDQILKKISKHLQTVLKEGDITARIGSNEFISLITKIKRPKVEINLLANKILEIFKDSFKINGNDIFLTASIGIAFYPSDGKTVEELLKNAGIAVYRSKEIRGSRFELYSIDMNNKVNEKLFIEKDLRKAIQKNQLKVYYQPIVDFKTGRITKAEALVRWSHPQRGLISPGKFIPLAEETGLIVPLGAYVLKNACQQLKKWIESGYDPIKISVNLSAQQLHNADLERTIKEILTTTDLQPDLLGIEITESIAIQNISLTSSMLEKFKKMGITVLLDDFGTGYSSLSYLTRFPIDILKIDRSFIKDISKEEKSAIISAIIAMANKLKIKTVAEGIETIKQFNLAKQYNCDEAQGYLFSKPVPATEFEKLLQKNQSFNNLNAKIK
ncbi:EAL domain-containing protein [Natroniella sp. ANB-PHB2]|uniref:EAL domain-containing protein n=1 Tax=Natroniella sp. ANB-PHB2 TaxID=3384444 RepID=UPI0038D364AE